MKKLGVLAFGLVMSTAVFAQDEASTEPTTDSGYAEPAPDQGEAGAVDSGDAAAAEIATETSMSGGWARIAFPSGVSRRQAPPR